MPTIAGMIILVPGGYGVRGMLALAIDGDITAGVSVVFTMLIIATELAISVILGNIILPPQGRTSHGLSALIDKIRSTNIRRAWRRIRGQDESVGIAVSSVDEDPDDNSSDENTNGNPFFASSDTLSI